MPKIRFRTPEDRLIFSEQQSRAWIDHSPICTKIVDLDYNLQFMSKAGVDALGMDDVSEFYGKPYPFDFYPDSFRNEMSKNLKKARESGEVVEQEAPVVDLEGNEIWFHSTISPVSESGEDIDYLMVVSIETTEQNNARKKLEKLNNELERKVKSRTIELEDANKKLRHISETDFLTQISNRFVFDKRIEESVAAANRNQADLAVLMIDIDYFKNYNDTYGHDVGDIILKNVAQTIAHSITRETDLAARFGGEEFVVLLPETNAKSALNMAEKIRQNISELEIDSDNQSTLNQLTVSVGVSSEKGNHLDSETLIKQADIALYLAKESGRNNCQIFKE